MPTREQEDLKHASNDTMNTVTQEDYEAICCKIFGYLIGVLGPEPIRALENRNVATGDGVGAWAALTAEYATGSLSNKRKLMRQIMHLKMQGPFNTLSAYVHEFNRIMNTLETMGVL